MEENGITPIGITNYRNTNQRFGIKDKDRLQHIYVIGKSGTGKSTLLENMAISDIERGNGLCIIDPHGDIAEDILKHIPEGRKQDLIYFNATDQIKPIAFNPLKGIHPKYHHLVASGLISTFKKIWHESWGPRMEYILRFTLLTLLCVPDATLLDIQPLLTDKEARKHALSYVGDESILAFWHNEFEKYSPTFRNEATSPILNKTGLFITSTPLRNILGQKTSSFRLDSTGAIKANYIYGIGLISRIDSAGNILYYHFNAQHNTIALSNDSGQITDTYTYEDFGTMLNHTGTTEQPYAFLGQYGVEQETPTLYYMRARYYDAANHRFLGKDPYSGTLEDPQTINRYIYALNNPLEYSDPTGLYAEKDNKGSVGQPGFAESLIPVWGSARAAVDDFQNGRWGWGIFNTVMAVSDLFLVKTLVTAVGKTVVKVAAQKAIKEAVVQESIEKVAVKQISTKVNASTIIAPVFNSAGIQAERTVARNLTEQLAMAEIKSNPSMGKIIMEKLGDPARQGWVKMRSTNAGVEIHYFAKWENGILKAVEGFKFK